MEVVGQMLVIYARAQSAASVARARALAATIIRAPHLAGCCCALRLCCVAVGACCTCLIGGALPAAANGASCQWHIGYFGPPKSEEEEEVALRSVRIGEVVARIDRAADCLRKLHRLRARVRSIARPLAADNKRKFQEQDDATDAAIAIATSSATQLARAPSGGRAH